MDTLTTGDKTIAVKYPVIIKADTIDGEIIYTINKNKDTNRVTFIKTDPKIKLG